MLLDTLFQDHFISPYCPSVGMLQNVLSSVSTWPSPVNVLLYGGLAKSQLWSLSKYLAGLYPGHLWRGRNFSSPCCSGHLCITLVQNGSPSFFWNQDPLQMLLSLYSFIDLFVGIFSILQIYQGNLNLFLLNLVLCHEHLVSLLGFFESFL